MIITSAPSSLKPSGGRLYLDADARESLRSDVVELEAMVTSLLESARLRHAAVALNLQSVNMGNLARSLASDFKDRLPGVVLGSLVDEPVKVDPQKMRIVLRNLVDNGWKHTPEGTCVTVMIPFG